GRGGRRPLGNALPHHAGDGWLAHAEIIRGGGAWRAGHDDGRRRGWARARARGVVHGHLHRPHLSQRHQLRAARAHPDPAPERHPRTEGMSVRRWTTPLAALAALALVALAPGLLSPFMVQFAINLFMLAILAESWNIIGGFTGYASFGNVAFFGIGAYTTGILMTKAGLSLAAALIAAGLVPTAFAALIGLPILRLKGHYFAIATLGVAETMREVVYNVEITGAGTGLVMPITRTPALFYYLMLGILVAVTLVNVWLARSRFG